MSHFKRRLGGPDVQIFINLETVKTDDFSFEMTRDFKGPIGFSRGRGPANANQGG